MPAGARLAALVATAAFLIASVSAVHYIQDEYLWTKGTWSDFKLKFPLQHFGLDSPSTAADGESEAAARNATIAAGFDDVAAQLPRRLPAGVSTAGLEKALDRFDNVSLRGALAPTLGGGQSHEGTTLPSGSLLEIIETDASVPKAAEVIKCQVCQHFAEEAWKGLVQWLLEGPQRRLSRARLFSYLPEICQWEVPQVFLREHVIMEGQVTTRDAGGGRGPQPQRSDSKSPGTLIVVSRRHGEATKIHELRSVRTACTNILAPLIEEARGSAAGAGSSEGGAEASAAGGGGKSAQADSIVSAFMSALDTMVSELEGIPGLGFNAGRANGIVRTRDAADGPILQHSCQDHNPQCPNWAKWGECVANAKYMLGHEQWPGNCRLSCGACSLPAHVRNRFLKKSQSEALLAAAERVVSRLERQICSDAPPCRSSVARVLSREFSNMRATARGGPGFATDEHGAEHPLPASRWPGSRVVLLRRASEALTGRPEAPPSAPEGGPPTSAAEQALARALHDRCLYVDSGWWSYELCWQLHVRQFRVPETRVALEQAHALGVYDAAASAKLRAADSGAAFGTLPESQLLKGTAGSVVPYVGQLYTGGSLCSFGGKDTPRTVQVRAACSPEPGTTHLVVQEPGACTYVAVLWTPALCGVPGLQPQWAGAAAQTMEAQLAGMSGGGRGSGGEGAAGQAASGAGATPGSRQAAAAAGSDGGPQKQLLAEGGRVTGPNQPRGEQQGAAAAVHAAEGRQRKPAGDGDSGSADHSEL